MTTILEKKLNDQRQAAADAAFELYNFGDDRAVTDIREGEAIVIDTWSQS